VWHNTYARLSEEQFPPVETQHPRRRMARILEIESSIRPPNRTIVNFMLTFSDFAVKHHESQSAGPALQEVSP
jgi:hypothetical protein